MSKRKKGRNTFDFYEIPLYKLLFWENCIGIAFSFIISAILLIMLVIIQPSRFLEYAPLIPMSLLFFFTLFVGFPVLNTLRFLWWQERVLHIKYKDRYDGNLPHTKRDWFLARGGNSVVLLNRDFISKVIRIFAEEDSADGYSVSNYRVDFLDCNGKKRSFKLDHLPKERDAFRAWYAVDTVTVEEDEDDVYLEEELLE